MFGTVNNKFAKNSYEFHILYPTDDYNHLLIANYNQQFINKRQMLINAVSSVVKEYIERSDKSMKLFSREYEFGDGQISKLLRGKYQDIKLSTLWKLANALDIKPIDFMQMINSRLPKNFNFYE